MAKKVTLNSLAASIEKLAQMTTGGFSGLRSEMNGRFDKVEKRLDNVEGRLNAVEDGLDRLSTDMSRVREHLKIADELEGAPVSPWDDHEERIVALEKHSGVKRRR